MSWLEILDSPLFSSSLLGLALLSFPFAWLGTTLIEKRMSLIADTFSHALLPGVVLAQLLLGTQILTLLMGGWLAGLLLAGMTWIIRSKSHGNHETSFAFLSLVFIAIGMTLAFKFQSSTDILHLLFGNVFLFDADLNLAIFILTSISFGLFWRKKSFWSLWVVDPSSLAFQSPKARLWGAVFVMFGTLALTLGLYSLGSLMLVGLLIIPALSAQLLFHRLYTRLLAAVVISLMAELGGLIISFQIDIPIGPALIISLTGLYGICWFLSSPKKRIPVATAIVLLGINLPHYARSMTPSVASTTTILDSLTQFLLADTQIETKTLFSIHHDPHDSTLSAKTLLGLKNISLFFYWDQNLDDRTIQTLKKQFKNANFCLASKGLENTNDIHHWLSPRKANSIVQTMSSCLKNTFKNISTQIDINTSKLIQKLEELDRNYQKTFQELPKNQKVIVTEHQAFTHIAIDYGLTILSLYGNDHHSEPSAKQFGSLIKTIKELNVHLYFSESENLSPLARRLIIMTNLRHAGRLYTDSLSDSSGPAANYLQLLEFNLKQMAQALLKGSQNAISAQ